jgi:hypothetical protein
MKTIMTLMLLSMLAGCIAGPPELTLDQEKRLTDIKVFMSGSKPDRDFNPIGEINSADCSGPGGSRLYGDEGKAIDILKMKAAGLNADAIIDVSCGSAPFVNNCWSAKKCTGKAVAWK